MLVCSHVPSHPHLVPGTPVHSISTSENNSFVQLNSARQLKGFFCLKDERTDKENFSPMFTISWHFLASPAHSCR